MHALESPPHPRGSTPGSSGAPRRYPVSPAPAGIDLSSFSVIACQNSLPRTRGDRPLASRCGSEKDGSPPHPRGSTADGAHRRAAAGVSPAPAGIDPSGCAGQGWLPGLPRTRGDRPVVNSRLAMMRRSPPHPRGSTPIPYRARSPSAVSPAPAGIDLSKKVIISRISSLPRTRGDRPGFHSR